MVREPAPVDRPGRQRIHVTLPVRDRFDPICRTDRRGEVVLVLLRPDHRLWLLRTPAYPRGIYRLPSGGIRHGESVREALVRETREETGWSLPTAEELAEIFYRFPMPSGDVASFSSVLFLLRCGLAVPCPEDEEEQISEYRLVHWRDLAHVAQQLEQVPESVVPGFGSWRDWGRFRAVSHRVVADLLRQRYGDKHREDA